MTQLVNNFFLAPGVALQQALANQTGFLQDFFSDPTSSTLADLAQQMQANLDAVLTGYGLINATGDTTGSVIHHTLDAAHNSLFTALPSALPSDLFPIITPILDFLASPLSGVIIGELGPFISPVVALVNSISAGDSFTDTLASTVGAFFNGATLNLDALIPIIAESGLLPLPPGTVTHHLGFAFGGLLTPGDVQTGPYEVAGAHGDIVASTPAVGGSIFNSLGISVTALGITLGGPGQPVGPIGAAESWAEIVAGLLGGSGWDGKGAQVVTPPGVGIDFPLIPTADVDDGGAGAAAAADLPSSASDIVAALGG